jgi:hypothetical protein
MGIQNPKETLMFNNMNQMPGDRRNRPLTPRQKKRLAGKIRTSRKKRWKMFKLVAKIACGAAIIMAVAYLVFA